jgi:hypothetical protein
LNLTGHADLQLKNGSCRNVTLLEHGFACSLTCEGNTAPQVYSNFMKAIDMSIICKDGEITHPPVGTWCSRDSYVLPPVVFLGTVTLASTIAGMIIDRRQRAWEKECLQVTRFRHPKVTPRTRTSRISAR